MYRFPDTGSWINPENDRIIAAVGAGGKSSVLEFIALMLKRSGRRVLLSTTTRIFHPEVSGFNRHVDRLIITSQPSLLQKPANNGTITVAGLAEVAREKIAGLPADIFTHLIEQNIYDNIIIEADGSRQLPLKAPSVHEPVIPKDCQTVIAVTGWSGLKQSVNPANIHRWDEFSRVTGLSAGDPVDARAIAKLLMSPGGLFKHTPASSRKIWLINQVDHNRDREQVKKLVRKVNILSPGLHHCLLSSFQNPAQPFIEEVPIVNGLTQSPITNTCQTNYKERL